MWTLCLVLETQGCASNLCPPTAFILVGKQMLEQTQPSEPVMGWKQARGQQVPCRGGMEKRSLCGCDLMAEQTLVCVCVHAMWKSI